MSREVKVTLLNCDMSNLQRYFLNLCLIKDKEDIALLGVPLLIGHVTLLWKGYLKIHLQSLKIPKY